MPFNCIEVVIQNGAYRVDNRNDALLVAFTANFQRGVVCREIFGVDADKLRKAKSALVKHQHHQRIAYLLEVARVDSFGSALKHLRNATLGNDRGQAFGSFQGADVGEYIAVNLAFVS